MSKDGHEWILNNKDKGIKSVVRCELNLYDSITGDTGEDYLRCTVLDYKLEEKIRKELVFSAPHERAKLWIKPDYISLSTTRGR